jgi:hypothetical protein
MAGKEIFIGALKYGGTFLAGLFAGGIMMQRAIQKAMSKNYEQMMGGMDPNAMQALAQQMQAGGGISPEMMQNVAGQLGPGGAPNLDVMVGAPQGNIAQQPNAMPRIPVHRAPIQPLNLTASQLGGSGFRV